jgi:hypothetical protein
MYLYDMIFHTNNSGCVLALHGAVARHVLPYTQGLAGSYSVQSRQLTVSLPHDMEEFFLRHELIFRLRPLAIPANLR